ncbi:putative patatin-like phospholipase domain, Acyl transferase/acyl hydrolase/lysophospholipase [Septoria linicola]|nr:putative patatin-like phospholipase domain, Acyl transferase/acyl hydrolase/lysophospholipase [Septoria linicola]
MVRVRRKDTTKGPPLRILSLDGGGIRGYSMLIILQELMHRTFVEIEGRAPARHEIPKPCDHFDLIVGTGTGGLIAIMLGRLRLDLDTCKDVYVRMTRKVFQTDKTVFGLPWKGTMFKASMLEEAIRETVRDHTIFEDEGNDSLANAAPMTPTSMRSHNSNIPPIPHRTMSQSSHYSQIGNSPMGNRVSIGSMKPGNPNALLYDTRENRTKTAVAAVLKGTSHTVLLRSYDSRKEPAPDVNCAIWQAGRATSATQMAFKPIQVGQSVYLDEGAGKYNPAPLVLDEAAGNEWPGREVGVFVSVGSGKPPAQTGANQHEWWEGFLGGSMMGDFADARRKMIQKLENCEKAHEFMLREHLASRNVSPEVYYRLNVEVGVGEFGMNEWARLAEISTSTRAYLSKRNVEVLTCGAASKIAKIHFTKIRHDRAEARRAAGTDQPNYASQNPWEPRATVPPPQNFAVELPGDDQYRPGQHYADNGQFVQHKYSTTSDPYERHNRNTTPTQQSYNSSPYHSPQISATRPSFEQQQPASVRYSSNSYQQDPSPRNSGDVARPPSHPPVALSSPPPVPPKTPVNGILPYPERNGPPQLPPLDNGYNGQSVPAMTFMNMGDLGKRLPYPVEEGGPPPPVNMGNKPTLS